MVMADQAEISGDTNSVMPMQADTQAMIHNQNAALPGSRPSPG